MGTIMHEPTVAHPHWCAASRCIPSDAACDVEHRSIPRPIAMDHVTGAIYLSGWGMSKDVAPSQLMVHAELESVWFVEKLLLMLSPAEAREMATALLVLAETAEGGA
jgi:hypothetical protein